MPKINWLAIVAALCPAPSLARSVDNQSETLAAPAPDRTPRAGFANIDKNNDGVITLDEWTAAGRRDRGFKFMDSDGDGKLTRQELLTGMRKFRTLPAPEAR